MPEPMIGVEIEELRTRFFDKLNKQGPPNADGFHPLDLERIRNNDKFVFNFLDYHDMELKPALDMLWNTCEWRRSYRTNELHEDNLCTEYLNDCIYSEYKTDIDGQPILMIRSYLHFNGMRKDDELIRIFVYWIERLRRKTDHGRLTLFFDLHGSGLKNLDMSITRNLVNLSKNYYPNCINYLLIFEMPWIFNAGFKVIKSFLPPKTVAAIRFISTKNIHEYIPSKYLLSRWGGSSDYEFVFLPDKDETSADGSSTNNDNNNTVLTRKVHFASNLSMPDTPLSDMSIGQSFGDKGDGVMLRINPEEAIHFAKSGNEMVGIVDITNIIQKSVTYKIKTTSPEKFRVRPSTGVLAPGAIASIHVVLLQGHNTLATLSKDKFLVMCMELSADASTSTQEITELWKNTPTTSALIEQHRLKCWPGNATFGTELGRNGSAITEKHFESLGADRSSRHIESTISQLVETTSRLESQVKFSQTLQWITMLVFLCLCIAVVYILKMEIKHASADYCIKRN